MGRLRTAPHAPLLTQAAAALLCMAVALATEQPAPGQEATQLFQPASGLVLALIVCGGRRLAPALGAGLLLQAALAGHAPLAALAHALGPVVAALVAAWLLRGGGRFDIDQPNFHVVGHVLLWACGVGAGTGALASTGTLVLTGTLAPEAWLFQCLQHWMGNALGILLVTPLVLAWRRTLRFPAPLRRVHEGLLVWTLTAAAAVAVFGNTVSPTLAPLANAYWMFLFVAWSGARLGLLPTMGLLCLIALQALWGTYQRTGFFARDIAASQGFGYWSYMMILGVVGLALAAWLAERRRQKTALRIAAIAFECQEGLLITDARGRILQANPALWRLTGYTLGHMQGRTAQFLCAPTAAPGAGLPCTPGRNVQLRIRLARKGGDVFPAWVSITPVHGPNAVISHYVISLRDITSLEEQEQRMAEHAATQRHALVREVHHRIKNNLQGIVGMLRTLDRQHPQLRGAIQQVVDQIQSIAAIHGLQGRAPSEEVRLCTLLQAIAESIAQNWNTPIALDIPPRWQPVRVASAEAVPVALVLNELLVNAVKHGGQAQQDVQASLHRDAEDGQVRVRISNPGHWPAPMQPPQALAGRGLDLVAALMPRSGARLTRHQAGGRATTDLVLSSPVIHAETPDHDRTHNAPLPAPSAAGGR